MEHIVINCETGEVSAISLTEEEKSEQEMIAEKVLQANQVLKQQEEERLAAREVAQAKLTTLGLTLDEIKALGL